MTTYTPDEYRAQVQKVRGLAFQIIGSTQFSLQSGIACGMLEIAADQLAQTQSDLKQRARENDFLRALVGNSDKACLYCGLGAENQAQCERGFPGCARADDQMLCRNFGDAAALHDLEVKFALTENAYNAALDLQTTLLDRCERLQALVDSQRKVIDTQAAFAETQPNTGER
jgi:hypothetical protein